MDPGIQRIAIGYVRRGWSVVPIPYRSKSPGRSGWRQLRLTETDVRRCFQCGRWNIGVLLGAPSGWLVDVDLDHELAVSLAPKHLPRTDAIFGRKAKRHSHWLYRVTASVATRQWRLPNRRMVVELRATGAQTVFPGSIHPTDEPIEWDIAEEPSLIDPNALQAAIIQIYEEVCRRLGTKKQPGTVGTPTAKSAPSSVIQRARRYLAKLPSAISGQGGHDATFRAACVLVIGFGLDRGRALGLLREWNERCQPTWSDKELEHKVDDAMRQPGWRGHLLSSVSQPSRRTVPAIERANRHAIAYRRRMMRRSWV